MNADWIPLSIAVCLFLAGWFMFRAMMAFKDIRRARRIMEQEAERRAREERRRGHS